MPSKPAKYGIKFWWACDSANSYPQNFQLYTGKIDGNRAERVVKDLIAPNKNTGRNITITLAKEMLSWKLSIVGTMKKNKRCLPIEFKSSRSRPILSTEFGFGQDVVLCSYVPKKDKAVVLLSTFHHDALVSGPKDKPEIIHYYNNTKGSVDTTDKMLTQYTTKRKIYRWPLAIFYNLLDVSALAAYIIFYSNNPQGPNSVKHSQRHEFLQRLGQNLCVPHIESRSRNRRVTGRFIIRNAMECILGKAVDSDFVDGEFIPNVREDKKVDVTFATRTT